MCDYSILVQSRPAKIGDKLITYNFGSGTIGFRALGEPSNIAVCVLPGTELAFDSQPRRHGLGAKMDEFAVLSKVAVFRQVNKQFDKVHHDSLEFADGSHSLLTMLREGQIATVLQLPATPKTDKEREEQKRVEYAG